ncbi:MAG: class I SAM-dependent methyltransferase [Clostridiales bacterium]|nr:class I SAM-dependent methyltransferase [Clostridiales bacterium]
MPDYYYTARPESAHEERRFRAVFGGRTLAFETDAGVFSKQHIDPGSELLCKALPDELAGRVLDMGCGWGAMTVMTLAAHPDVQMTMADVNERALALAVRNVAANGMRAEALLSDGFERVEGVFDAVITNPPIRAGKAVIYKMFEDAKAHLVPGGALYLVIRKQQGAPSALKFLRELYAGAEVIARDGGYWVIRCVTEDA